MTAVSAALDRLRIAAAPPKPGRDLGGGPDYQILHRLDVLQDGLESDRLIAATMAPSRSRTGADRLTMPLTKPERLVA